MWETIKERFSGDDIFFWLAIAIIMYVNHTFFDKHINIILFILPIAIMYFMEIGLKKPPRYPKYLLTIIITALYMFSMPKYSTTYAENFMKENYGEETYLLPYTTDQMSSFNPYSKDINYSFIRTDGKEYLFNARTGEVKETKIDIYSKWNIKLFYVK